MSRATAMKDAQILREAYLDWGVPEVSIELQVGVGDLWDVGGTFRGVLAHHIASTPTPARPTPGLSVVKKGRSDLRGPLANATAGVDLVARVLTLGPANHSGKGGALGLRGPFGNVTIPKNNGNRYLFGIEFEGGYTDAVWDRRYTNVRTKKSMDFHEFMARMNGGSLQAIYQMRGHSVAPTVDLTGYFGEHKTWAPGRKPDRRGYDTASGRAAIQRYQPKVAAPVERERVSPSLRTLFLEEAELHLEATTKGLPDSHPIWREIGKRRAKMWLYTDRQFEVMIDEQYAAKDAAYRARPQRPNEIAGRDRLGRHGKDLLAMKP